MAMLNNQRVIMLSPNDHKFGKPLEVSCALANSSPATSDKPRPSLAQL